MKLEMFKGLYSEGKVSQNRCKLSCLPNTLGDTPPGAYTILTTLIEMNKCGTGVFRSDLI